MIRFGKARAFHLKVGKAGEDAAVKLLESKNMEILMRNYKCGKGEIDIVARDGANIVFIEVKTRSVETNARPSEGLLPKQRNRIFNAALNYLDEIENPAVIYRFDFVEVITKRLGIKRIAHWQEHFTGFDSWKAIRK
ncbi:MAG: hypothetical protein A2020_05910 [Lentisphaerae bacterium GWF2_45_14]|nr:MAG: hypothetical protein A2020_05910 [Lentisphaerae bacterium GWF2_45_14]